MDQFKEYYAFISYNREDIKEAKKLQRALEYYRLPNNLRRDNPKLPEYVRPVFRDMTDMEVGGLSEQIHNGLEQSHFLIVVCSPRAATSKWVNDEVEYFISLGKKDKIIPYIIEGTPHSCNPIEECYPPALLQLSKDEELLGANINEVGKESATIRVVSKMFNIRFDILYKRYERELRRTRWLWILCSVFIALLGISIALIFIRQNSLIKEQNKQLETANWNMMSIQSKAVSERAEKLISEGDSYLASMLALAVLPENLHYPDRPFCLEAEKTLREAIKHNDAVLKGHLDKVNTAFFNNDGTRIVSASDDGTVRIWDSGCGAEIELLDASAGFVSCASFSPDSKNIVAGYKDCFVRIWDVNTKKVQRTLKGHSGNILSCSYSHNGKYIVSSAGGDNTIRIWDSDSGENLITIKGLYDVHNSVSFSPDDKYIVSAGLGDNSIRIWDSATGKEIKKIPGNSVFDVSYSHDGKHLVASSGNNAVQVWDIVSGIKLFSLSGHLDYVECSVFSPDDKYIATASADNRIILWNATNGKKIRTLSGHNNAVTSVAFSPEGDKLISSSADKTIRIWDLTETSESTILKGNDEFISFANMNISGDIIVSASRSNGIIHFWEKNNDESWKEIKTITGHSGFVFTVLFSPDGNTILSSSMDNTIRLWNVTDGTLRQNFKCGAHLNGIARFSPNGKLIAFGDGTVLKIIEVDSGTFIKELTDRKDKKPYVFTENVSSIAFSPDGRYIATATYLDKSIRVWDWENGTVIKLFDGHTDAVTSVAFSPDGNHLISGSYDNTVRIWSMNTPAGEVLRMDGDDYFISCVTYSPDGRYIAAGGASTISVWDANSGIRIDRFIGHKSHINSIQYSNDGRIIISSSDDGTIRMWDYPPIQELIDTIRERFKNRPLTSEERRENYLE